MRFRSKGASGAVRTIVFVGVFTLGLAPTTAGPVLANPSAAKLQTASFQGLGQMPGECCGTDASGISGDGSTIVGEAYVALNSAQTEAYRWTAAHGYQLLGDLGSSGPSGSGSAAYAASFDGSVVVGEAPVGTNSFGAFRWTAAQGMMALPMNVAYAVTGDGTMVAGSPGRWSNRAMAGNGEEESRVGNLPNTKKRCDTVKSSAPCASGQHSLVQPTRGADLRPEEPRIAGKWTPATSWWRSGVLEGTRCRNSAW